MWRCGVVLISSAAARDPRPQNPFSIARQCAKRKESNNGRAAELPRHMFEDPRIKHYIQDLEAEGNGHTVGKIRGIRN